MFACGNQKKPQGYVLLMETLILLILSPISLPFSGWISLIIPILCLAANAILWAGMKDQFYDFTFQIARDKIESIRTDTEFPDEWHFKYYGRAYPELEIALYRGRSRNEPGTPVILVTDEMNRIIRLFIGDGFRLPEDEKEKKTP